SWRSSNTSAGSTTSACTNPSATSLPWSSRTYTTGGSTEQSLLNRKPTKTVSVEPGPAHLEARARQGDPAQPRQIHAQVSAPCVRASGMPLKGCGTLERSRRRHGRRGRELAFVGRGESALRPVGGCLPKDRHSLAPFPDAAREEDRGGRWQEGRF